MGSQDADGNLLGGTEIRALKEFDGKLFAANGYWTDKFMDQPWLPGAQVFVLDKSQKSGGKWKQDLHIEERLERGKMRRRFHTISAMETVTFHTDEDGNALAEPIDLLVVGVWDRLHAVNVWTRDKNGEWQQSTLSEDGEFNAPWHVRSFAAYRDKVTGVDLLMAGTSGRGNAKRGIFHATYDPSVPGRLKWHRPREAWGRRPGPHDRVMSFAQANGNLYATVCGKLYQRIDGPSPRWSLRNRHPQDRCPDRPGEWSFRGATSFKSPKGNDSILFAMEGTSIMGRWDFGKRISRRRELALRPFLRPRLKRSTITYTIAAYNGFAPITLPSGELVHLAGIETKITDGARNTWHSWQKGAYFLSRNAKGRYRLHQIPGEKGEGPMVAVRALIQSPFDDEPNIIYAAGFDANHVDHVNHNTGWLYRGEIRR